MTQRGLAIVEDADRDSGLLDQARAFAAGDGDDLVVVALATPDEYEEVAETLDTIGRVEGTSYDHEDVLDGIAGDVEDLAVDLLAGIDHEVRAEILERDEQAERILELAAEADCDHVFLPGRKRSPTGKAVFGDRTQHVILEFDGYVTVEMR